MRIDEALSRLDLSREPLPSERQAGSDVLAPRPRRPTARLGRLAEATQRELAHRALLGDRQASAELLSGLEPLLSSLVRRYRARPVEEQDLLQVARTALLEALRRYDPAKGVLFSTFAYKRVAGALADAVRNAGHALTVPDDLRRSTAEAAACEERLAQRFGRWPSWDEVAAELGIDHRRLALLRAHSQWPVSLERLTRVAEEVGSSDESELDLGDPDRARAVESSLASVEGTVSASEVGVGQPYTSVELSVLLAEYAGIQARRETQPGCFDRRLRITVGESVIARMVDLDQALVRVPTEFFVLLELHGLKGLSLREQRPFTGIPSSTAAVRFHLGLVWMARYLNGETPPTSSLREPFWRVDLDPRRFQGIVDLELWARRGAALALFDGKSWNEVRERPVGDGWLLQPQTTGFL